MKVLIIEDEPLAAERLSELLLQYDPKIQVLKVIDTVEDAVGYIQQKQDLIDLAFFDIQLADGKSFEIFKEVAFQQPIIFTTAFDQYALDAFKVNSIDYLLKPIKYEELTMSLDKHKNLNSIRPISKALIEQLQQQEYKKRFLVKFGKHIQFKRAHEIALFEADGHLCHIYDAQSGKKYLIDHTLEELEDSLLNPEKFFRISRKHIINIDGIKDISIHNSCSILPNFPFNDKLGVSRSRVKDFKNWIDA